MWSIFVLKKKQDLNYMLATWVENHDTCFVFFNISRCWASLSKQVLGVFGGLPLHLKPANPLSLAWICIQNWFECSHLDLLSTGLGVCTFKSGVSVPDVTLLSHQVLRLLMYCKSARAVFRGEEIFSCDFIVIFIFSKLLLWILILSTGVQNVY